MPLPWKVVKSTRVSQLVNDHLRRSRKRRDGSSLFVETGFPTSLVDLFIKNRDKLRKPSKKKIQSAPIAGFLDPTIAEGEIPTTPFNSPANSPSRSPSVSSTAGSIECLDEKEIVHETGVVDASKVPVLVLKVFLVVVLALGTKRLTALITVSAFLLFFLEYAGKRVRSTLKPLSETVQCVLRLFRFTEDSVPKIIQDEVSRCQTGHREAEPDEVFVVREEESNYSNRKSRRAMIKSKIRELVPKKLRCSRKDGSLKRVVTGGDEEEHSVSLCDERVVRYEDEREIGNGSELSSVSSWRYDEEGDYDNIPVLGELSESVAKREGKRDGIKNRRYLVVCMVALAGLVGGRALAVLLTLSWLLMLKLGDKSQRCVVKVLCPL